MTIDGRLGVGKEQLAVMIGIGLVSCCLECVALKTIMIFGDMKHRGR